MIIRKKEAGAYWPRLLKQTQKVLCVMIVVTIPCCLPSYVLSYSLYACASVDVWVKY